MKYVYQLEHKIEISKGVYNYKEIGWFSSKKKAKKVRKQYRKFPGFKKTPKCFVIKKYKINEILGWEPQKYV